MHNKRFLICWFQLGLVFILMLTVSACGTLTRPEQPIQRQLRNLEEGKELGQTFSAHFDGLNSVAVFLSPTKSSQGVLRFHIRPNVENGMDVAVVEVELENIQSAGYYHFPFPSIKQSMQENFYFSLDVVGPGEILVGTAPADTYLNGAMYWNETPDDAQVAFSLGYEIPLLVWGIFKEFFLWMLVLLAACYLLILPGWGVLKWLWADWDRFSFLEKCTISAPVGMSLYPVLFLWSYFIGLQPGWLFAALPLCALFFLWRDIGSTVRSFITGKTKRPDVFSILRGMTFFAILGMIVFSRFWVIRTLDAPMWGDSYQHTLIAQLLVDHGGLFNNWEPYAPLNTLTYHFGFHSLAAVFHWLTRLPLEKSVLYVGQILNIVACLAVYPFAVKAGKNHYAGVIAVLISGLISPMPMVYFNWGRYTQLSGQAILAVVMLLAWEYLEKQDISWREAGLLSIIVGGLALTHYRILIFVLLFMAPLFLIELIYRTGSSRRKILIGGCILGIGVAVVFLPWFLHIAGGQIMMIFSNRLATPASNVPGSTLEYNMAGPFSDYLPPVLWFLIPLVWVWGMVKRERGVSLVGVWCILLVLATNPHWIGLPGTGVISNFAVLIFAYLPASVMVGAAFGWVINEFDVGGRLENWSTSPKLRTFISLRVVLALIIFFAGLWGMRLRLKDVHLFQGVLFTSADRRAAEWIKKETPDSAIFLINSFFAYGDTLVVGADGGWWLPFFTRRQATVPNLLYGVEGGIDPTYRDKVNSLSLLVREKGLDDPAVIQSLKKRNVTHVYIGQRQGAVNNLGAVIEPAQLLANDAYRLVYRQDRVWIFEIR